jgi:hypothetical protein
MHQHISLAQRLRALRGAGQPTFEASTEPTLLAFAELFLDSELVTFDANKRLRDEALTPLYDCETESRRYADTAPEKFVVIWTPVWSRSDPGTGFRTGRDSAAFGSTPTIAMPQDERTTALLLLVTTAFVHLSGSRDGTSVTVQGAIETGDNTYRYLTLAPSAFGAPLQQS